MDREMYSSMLDGLERFWGSAPDFIKEHTKWPVEDEVVFLGDYHVSRDQMRHVIEAEGAGGLTAEQSRRLARVKQLRERYEPDVLRIRAQG